VRSREELKEALSLAFTITDRVIIEPLLERKRELECGYLRIESKDLFTNCGEILCDGFYDYQKKYGKNGATSSTVAELTKSAQDKIRDYSAALVRGLGVRDIARIDYFLSGDKIYFNEINTMPGMTESSLYPKMIEASGVSLDQMTEGLIRGALYGR
jgi:D-alanine-D-alanine ligase